MALTADTARIYGYNSNPEFEAVPAKAATKIYQGAAVGSSSGYGRGLVAADVFLGFAEEQCDNSVGSAGNGDKNIKVRSRGEVQLTVTGVTAVTDVGTAVYASADGTFTLTSTGNSSIGKVARWITSTTCIVYFEAGNRRSI